jgi:hypothetical protein
MPSGTINTWRPDQILLCTMVSALLSCQWPATLRADSLVLVKTNEQWGGEPSSLVVLRSGASYQERFAAQQFVSYVQRANKSDALLGLTYGVMPTDWKGSAVVVGVAGLPPFEKVNAKQLPEHGFHIYIESNRLNIVGQSFQGASNALYWLLWEKIGVRWYLPTRLGEEVPVHDQIVLSDIDITAGPDYPASSFHAPFFGSAANRTTVSGMRRDMNSRHIWEEVVAPTPENHEQHPEWFALTDRKDMPKEDWMKFIWKDKNGGIRSNQVCTTNPEVIQLFIDYARKFCREDPEVRMISLEPNDYHDFCTCPRCKELDQKLGNGPLMNRLVHFMNQIAREIKKEFPDKTFGIYAYSSHVDPPTGIKPDPAIVPTLCFFASRACYQHAIDDSSCPTNREWKKTVLDPWTKLSRRFGYYSYYSYSRKWQGPQLMLRTMPRDMKLMHDRGAFYFHIDGWSNWATCAPMRYLAQRLIWDADADPNTVLDDWYRGTYGPAYASMKAYWETMTDGYYQGTHRSSGPTNPEQMFTRDIVEKAWTHLKQAEMDLAKAPDRYKRRVKIARAGLEYTDAMAMGYQHAADGKWSDAVTSGQQALAAIVASREVEPAPYITPMWSRDEHAWIWYRAWDNSNSSEKMTQEVIDSWQNKQGTVKPTREND